MSFNDRDVILFDIASHECPQTNSKGAFQGCPSNHHVTLPSMDEKIQEINGEQLNSKLCYGCYYRPKKPSLDCRYLSSSMPWLHAKELLSPRRNSFLNRRKFTTGALILNYLRSRYSIILSTCTSYIELEAGKYVYDCTRPW